MKKVHLIRYYGDDDVTLGILYIEGIKHKPIYTLENPWRDNVRNISCIPAGQYECEAFSGMQHKNCYQICNVKDRGYILIHVGNWQKDTQGCILVGRGVILDGAEYMVPYSALTLNKFKDLLNYETFLLNISYQYHIGE